MTVQAQQVLISLFVYLRLVQCDIFVVVVFAKEATN